MRIASGPSLEAIFDFHMSQRQRDNGVKTFISVRLKFKKLLLLVDIY